MEAHKTNDAEKELINAINKVNIDEVRRLLSSSAVSVNCHDEQGMSPLMHAAYKGNVEITEILLAHGADVNSNQHEHRYSALMFSCVAGASEVTRLLLEAGANVNAENNLGKTAAQLGAFVGQHECVSILNNFISKDDLLYYTKPQGFEKEGKLQAKLVPSLYK
ncbi:ankyrin repeat and MYND domain-containing protein 2, partial [Exaiptasia diaphana]|uniref:Ankyrin repeat domain-containing protein n=1 Tax=Exaiptasia diaphana TaxID=2652724 RepID=A0A913WX89_EXADI